PPRSRHVCVLSCSRVPAERNVRDVKDALVDDRVGTPRLAAVEYRKRIVGGSRRPPFDAIRTGEAEIARTIERHVSVRAVALVVVAVVTPHDDGSERRLHVAEPPVFGRIDHCEDAPAESGAT